MGVWGNGIYENDFAKDIEVNFNDYVANGTVPSVAVVNILEMYNEELTNSLDGLLGYRALTDLAYKADILSEKLFNEAQEIISAANSRNWLSQRKKLQKILCIKNLSVHVVQNVVSLKKLMSGWTVGDVFALPLDNDICAIYGCSQEFLIFRVIKEAEYIGSFGNVLMYVKITNGGRLPTTTEEYNELEYIQVAATNYEDRFRPFSSEKALPQDLRQDYKRDAWGYLPQFAVEVMESHNNYPPASLIFLGNFPDVASPVYSFKPYKSYPGCAWNYADEYCLKRYQLYNLKRASIYKTVK